MPVNESGSPPIRILIAEDDSTLRETLAELLNSESSFEVVGAASDAREAVELAGRHKPSVALVDVKMPQGGGPKATLGILKNSSTTRVLALSAYEDRATVLLMLRAGASGYLVKSSSAEEIVSGVRRCAAGETVLSPGITADVLKELLAVLDRSDEMARSLADLNRVKSELIQTLSHELRTHLTVIVGTVPMLTKKPILADADQLAEMAAAMRRATSRLLRVAENITSAAGLELEEKKFRRPTLVADIVQAAVREFPGESPRFLLSENLQGDWAVG